MIAIKYKYRIIISCLLICLFGLLMVYSSSNIWALYKFNDSLYYLKHQCLFFVVGLIVMFIISKIDYKLYLKYSNKILLLSLILLVLVLNPAKVHVRN